LIDVSHNKLSKHALEEIIVSLKENNSIVGFDARFNTGTSSKVLKKIALCMLKNFSIMQKKK
jgi:hypothetical protein